MIDPRVRTDKLTTSLLFYCLNTGVTSSYASVLVIRIRQAHVFPRICVIGVLVSVSPVLGAFPQNHYY